MINVFLQTAALENKQRIPNTEKILPFSLLKKSRYSLGICSTFSLTPSLNFLKAFGDTHLLYKH
jgi:hypothetical protein